MTLSFVAVCPACGALLDVIELTNAGDPWAEPMLWGALAQTEHDKTCPRKPQVKTPARL